MEDKDRQEIGDIDHSLFGVPFVIGLTLLGAFFGAVYVFAS